MIFIPGRELYLLGANYAEEVYKDFHSIGLTQFNLFNDVYRDQEVQILPVAGTNQKLDWFWHGNFDLRSIKGIKIGGYKEAETIFNSEYFNDMRDPKLPLFIQGHSRGGPAAIALKREFCKTNSYCIAFAPARSLRYNIDRFMKDTTLFIDHDDPVPMFGFISFGHPRCERIYCPDDHFGYSVFDHPMSKYKAFIEKMKA